MDSAAVCHLLPVLRGQAAGKYCLFNDIPKIQPVKALCQAANVNYGREYEALRQRIHAPDPLQEKGFRASFSLVRQGLPGRGCEALGRRGHE